LCKDRRLKLFVLKEGNRNIICAIKEKGGYINKTFSGESRTVYIYIYQHPVKQNNIASCWLLLCPSV
jgi:hypothetical protein